MFEEINTAPLICVRIKRRWASSFIPNKRPHQLVMLVDLMDACLIPRDLIARSSQWASLETVHRAKWRLRAWPYLKAMCWVTATRYRPKHWWPALMVHDRFPDKSGGHSVLPAVLCVCVSPSLSVIQYVWASQRFDLHTRWGSVPTLARPLKDDKIQRLDGSCEPRARGLFTRGF